MRRRKGDPRQSGAGASSNATGARPEVGWKHEARHSGTLVRLPGRPPPGMLET
jgi:hypothetical protein